MVRVRIWGARFTFTYTEYYLPAATLCSLDMTGSWGCKCMCMCACIGMLICLTVQSFARTPSVRASSPRSAGSSLASAPRSFIEFECRQRNPTDSWMDASTNTCHTCQVWVLYYCNQRCCYIQHTYTWPTIAHLQHSIYYKLYPIKFGATSLLLLLLSLAFMGHVFVAK